MFVLMPLWDMPRADTREYLAQIGRRHRDVRQSAAEMTVLFEQARYGAEPVSNPHIQRMRNLYRGIYRRL